MDEMYVRLCSQTTRNVTGNIIIYHIYVRVCRGFVQETEEMYATGVEKREKAKKARNAPLAALALWQV